MRQVLLLLDGIVLFGRERGNIDVMQHLRSRQVPAMVAIHEVWGRQQIAPYLEDLSLPWCEMDFHDRLGRTTTLKAWLVAVLVILKANVQLARHLLKNATATVQISNPQTLLNFLPLLWLVRKPVVMRCGDTPAAHTAGHRWLWKICFRRVNRFVVISEHVGQKLIDLGCPPTRLKTVYSRPFRRPQASDFVPPVRTSKLVLGFLGQLEPHKGIDHLVQACTQLDQEGQDFQLIVAGHTTDCWKALTADHGDADWLRHVGHVGDISGFFAAVDLLVVPSVCEEALGAVVLEAKQAGVAALVYPRGGLPELVRQGVDGLICEQPSVNSLKAALDALCHESDQVRAMGVAARESAAHFEQQFEQGWDEVYAL